MKIESDNLQYCLCFLYHGGERLRAVKLAKDVLGMNTQDAVRFVERVANTYGENKRNERREQRAIRDRLNAENPSDYPI